MLRNAIALLAVLVGVAGCYSTARYDGDGQLTDAGWWVIMGYRYSLDLGPVVLTSPGTYVVRLKGLPNAQFTAGIEVVEDAPIPLATSQAEDTTNVRLELKTSAGEIVVLEEGPLNTWV